MWYLDAPTFVVHSSDYMHGGIDHTIRFPVRPQTNHYRILAGCYMPTRKWWYLCLGFWINGRCHRSNATQTLATADMTNVSLFSELASFPQALFVHQVSKISPSKECMLMWCCFKHLAGLSFTQVDCMNTDLLYWSHIRHPPCTFPMTPQFRVQYLILASIDIRLHSDPRERGHSIDSQHLLCPNSSYRFHLSGDQASHSLISYICYAACSRSSRLLCI